MFAILLTVALAASPDQSRMHELHSAHRVRNGFAAQVLDDGLCRQAQRLAEAQAASGSMWHSGWGWNENVAGGYSVDGSIAAWIHSSGHNANLLSRSSHVGFGYHNGFSSSLHGDHYEGPDLSVTRMAASGGRRRIGRRR